MKGGRFISKKDKDAGSYGDVDLIGMAEKIAKIIIEYAKKSDDTKKQ